MVKTKYIKTRQGLIIVFSAAMQHSDFQHFEPVSAGFIGFGVNKDGENICYCYGESISLGLKSDPDDTRIATFQILN